MSKEINLDDMLAEISSGTPNINDIISSKKKKKVPSIFKDEFQQQQKTIVIPKMLQDEVEEIALQKIQAVQTIEKLKQKSQQRAMQDFIPTIQEQEAARQELETIIGEKLPENIDVIAIEKDVVESLNEIPDGSDFDISDVEIITSPTKKDKIGYYKTQVNIKKINIPKQINVIASYVKRMTKGLISPRVCDLRVIANTNKTQLRGSTLKLSAATIVFKPTANKLKVNKGTRFMISVPENYASTGNLLIYIQESRIKKILEVTAKDFNSKEEFSEFIGDRIAEYYFSGYEITMKKIELRGVDNPLMSILTKAVATKDYKGKPYTDENGHIYCIEFISTGTINQWLSIKITETSVPNLFEVTGHNNVDENWNIKLNKTPVTINKLQQQLLTVLFDTFSKDWSESLNKDLDEFYYQYTKLSHAKLKLALLEINSEMGENPTKGILIKQVLSKRDTAKIINGDYDAEAIIGKTSFIDYFILTYLAFQIVGGDARKGEDYITTDEYYEKYDVKDKRDYQEREKTILKKEGVKRNYNSRIYVFQLEYSVNKEKHIYRSKNWQELLSDTGLLSDTILFPQTKF